MQQTNKKHIPKVDPEDVVDIRDCLQLLIIEYGDTQIDTLAHLLHLTSSVEIEFSHLSAQRLS
jgi:hypothetical protein